MNLPANYIGKNSFWQLMEGRKRRYQALEQHNFALNVDYDQIFTQIDKELSDECVTKENRNQDFKIRSIDNGEQESEC